MISDSTIDVLEAKRRYGAGYADGYDARRFETAEGYFAQRFELELFERVLNEYGARNVLDAPVGTGRVAIPLADRFSITGADISPAMIESGKERARSVGVENITWIECSVDKLPFPDGHFDAVVTARLFQHVPREAAPAIVAELMRVIKPGGVLICQFRSGLYGLALKFLRYYVTRRTGNIRHKCIFPDQVDTHYFAGRKVVARYGYKFPISGRLTKLLGFAPVLRVERAVASLPGVRWFGKYMTFVVQKPAVR